MLPFRDYLTREPWRREALVIVFQVMASQLHCNVAKIHTLCQDTEKYFHISGRKMGDTISPELQYACRYYWSDHLSAARTLDESLLRHLSYEKLLFWIEAACLIERFDVGNVCKTTASLIKVNIPVLMSLC